MISVIFSSYNEENNPFFRRSLQGLKTLPVEVICVDGGSTDGTKAFVEAQGHRFLIGDPKARAHRYNLGLREAKFDLILFHHPRSFLMREGIEHLLAFGPRYHWGAFTHRFDVKHPALDFTSWYSNHVRGDLKGIYYLDHCLFARRSLLQKIGGFPPLDIFEDTEICLELKKLAPFVRLPYHSTTSAVRFQKNGILKQAWLNQKMKIAYLLRRDKSMMYREYEKGLDLNTNFKE